MFRLDHRVGVVTGGARGIGKAISKVLAKQGALVVVADMRFELAEQTAFEINASGGVALATYVDVTDIESVKKMAQKVREIYGPIDILVNNVGWDKMMLFSETDPDFWSKVIDINYRSVLNCVYVFMNDMIQKKRGRIVSIGSDAAKVGSSGESVYSGAKGAIISFSKTMARELARYNITVNVVCPGPTETPLVEEIKGENELGQKILGSIEKFIPLGRIGRPEDVAYAVAFLVSDEAEYITGQVLSVNGGLTMC
ncbi:MAG: 3-oxoacyl-ACP reductase FabG [Syntrophobacterales bacterium]|nr:3-oxoacyl-ACP reductase FabG [Syntrophobacterales bacterium]